MAWKRPPTESSERNADVLKKREEALKEAKKKKAEFKPSVFRSNPGDCGCSASVGLLGWIRYLLWYPNEENSQVGKGGQGNRDQESIIIGESADPGVEEASQEIYEATFSQGGQEWGQATSIYHRNCGVSESGGGWAPGGVYHAASRRKRGTRGRKTTRKRGDSDNEPEGWLPILAKSAFALGFLAVVFHWFGIDVTLKERFGKSREINVGKVEREDKKDK